MSTVASTATHALGLTTQEREIAIDELPLQGELPAWLAGSLLRTGPARWEIGGRSLAHWFDGLAMLHRFTIDGGRVSYANRYLESQAYRAARDGGELAYREFASDPCRSLFKRVHSTLVGDVSDNGVVNIGRLGERFVAMTETPLPVEFDPSTLAAAGVPFEAPGQLSTAHPHRDRATGAMLNYAAKLGPRSSYRFFTVGPESVQPRVLASLPVREPSYMHSFGLTERYFVLAEFPLVVNPLRLAASGRPYIENYRWKPERGTRFTLIDRASGEVAGRYRTDARFAFHHVNAYEEGDEVVVDLCTWDDAKVIEDLYLERMRAGLPISRPRLERFRLGGGVRVETLSERSIELSSINYGRCNERRHRYVWGVGADSGWFDAIVKIDVEEGLDSAWSAEGQYPGEPIFVARPDASAEDDGVLLSVVLDAEREASSLLVLDAATLDVVARADVPQHVPFGFHGQFARG